MYSYKFLSPSDEFPSETRTNGDTSGGFVTFGTVVDWTKQKHVNGVLVNIPVEPVAEPEPPTADEIQRQALQQLTYTYQAKIQQLIKGKSLAELNGKSIDAVVAEYTSVMAEWKAKVIEVMGAA